MLTASGIALLLVGCSLFGIDKSKTTDNKFIEHYQFITRKAVDQYGSEIEKSHQNLRCAAMNDWNMQH